MYWLLLAAVAVVATQAQVVVQAVCFISVHSQ
jgi:hypothetical protein